MAEWLKDAVFYEIYPQSFQDTNADGIGDFQGIIDRLDYIKELGCNAIWMNPCFASPFGDAGYDVSDYYTAAPRYGTNEDLKRLFDEVHKKPIPLYPKVRNPSINGVSTVITKNNPNAKMPRRGYDRKRLSLRHSHGTYP